MNNRIYASFEGGSERKWREQLGNEVKSELDELTSLCKRRESIKEREKNSKKK